MKLLRLLLLLCLVMLLIACNSDDEPEIAEVTRVVTETITEQVEVTRMVEGESVTQVVEVTRLVEDEPETQVVEVTRVVEDEPEEQVAVVTKEVEQPDTDDFSIDATEEAPQDPNNSQSGNDGDTGPQPPSELRFSFGGGDARPPESDCWHEENKGKFVVSLGYVHRMNIQNNGQIGALFSSGCGLTYEQFSGLITTPTQEQISFSNLETYSDENGTYFVLPIFLDSPTGVYSVTFIDANQQIVEQLAIQTRPKLIVPAIEGIGWDSSQLYLWDFEPSEMVRLFFYRGNDNANMELLGSQDVQMNSSGYSWVNVGEVSPDQHISTAAIRSNGEEVYVDLLVQGFWDNIVVSNAPYTAPEVVDPNTIDSDGDGLVDAEETDFYGTDPYNADTDADGRSDADEVYIGTNPNNPMNVDGIVQVYHADGEFTWSGPGEWIETNSNGTFVYEELGRDAWSIYLYDGSRDWEIQLDIWTMEVKCHSETCPDHVLYYIDAVSEGLACPFVFTFDETAQSWEFDTTIIYKLVGSDSEKQQWRELQQFDGRLYIREIEPEISYLDHVFVVVVDENGQEIVLEHNFVPLQAADDNYFVMHQGDEKMLIFPGFDSLVNVVKVWVVAEGYYEPVVNP